MISVMSASPSPPDDSILVDDDVEQPALSFARPILKALQHGQSLQSPGSQFAIKIDTPGGINGT